MFILTGIVAGEGRNKLSQFKAYAALTGRLRIPLFWEPTRRSVTEYSVP
jgi:hypothetical protein